MFKSIITKMLERQARRLLKKYKPRIVAVTGSVGKTSTKIGIATVLSQQYRVLAHYGSYNTHIAVPMAMFNLKMPQHLTNPIAWLGIWFNMERQLHKPYPYDVLVLELGTNHPGEIAYFSRYLHPDLAVVTAVAAEHMEFFGDLTAVAKEELAVTDFSNLSLINRDDISAKFAADVQTTNIDTYGGSGVAEYHYLIEDTNPGTGFTGTFVSPEFGNLPVNLKVIGEHNIRAAVAAGAVGVKMGLNATQITAGMQQITPVHGRMNILKGLKDSTIIDDTYNASPIAVIAALQTLYLFPAKQHIAILGSMNELGDYSKQAHEQVGAACDSAMLDWVITIGADAEKYLAPAAASKGCQVRSFASPYDAGAFAHEVLQREAVVLAKGSQNGVFAEEALKVLLHSPDEEEQLVRQTPDWLAIKQKQFGKFK